MPSALRNVLAFVVGVVIGGVMNMAIVVVGPILIPPPEGVDMADMDRFAENLKLLKPVNFIAPWFAHAGGTLVGAFLAAKLAASHEMKLALGVGVFFLLGGVTMVGTYGGPLWFILLDLLVAYIPTGYLGGLLAGAKRHHPGTAAQPAK